MAITLTTLAGCIPMLLAGNGIPVAMDETLEISEASGIYQRSLSSEASVLKYWSTIHRSLQSQS